MRRPRCFRGQARRSQCGQRLPMDQLLTAEEGQNGPRLVKRREAVVDQARVVEVGEPQVA